MTLVIDENFNSNRATFCGIWSCPIGYSGPTTSGGCSDSGVHGCWDASQSAGQLVTQSFAGSTGGAIRIIISYKTDASGGPQGIFFIRTGTNPKAGIFHGDNTGFHFSITDAGAVYIDAFSSGAGAVDQTADGVVPVDGTVFAVQIIYAIAARLATFDIYVNDVLVDTLGITPGGTVSDTEFGGAADLAYLLHTAGFDGQYWVDNFQVDTDNSVISWLPCSGATPICSTSPVAVITDLALDYGTGDLTITGTGFRASPGYSLTVVGPDGETPDYSTVSASDTTIVLHLTSPRDGRYCVSITNSAICFENC